MTRRSTHPRAPACVVEVCRETFTPYLGHGDGVVTCLAQCSRKAIPNVLVNQEPDVSLRHGPLRRSAPSWPTWTRTAGLTGSSSPHPHPLPLPFPPSLGGRERAAEAQTGVRLWRRTDLLIRRIEQERERLRQAEEKVARARERVEQARQRLDQAEQERQEWAQKVAELEALYRERNRPERPHSRLAQARRRLSV